MGYLTTFTIYNDGADELEKNPQELARILHEATMEIQRNRGNDQIGLGSHANLLTLQKPRHADDHTLYLHAGNTVVDVWEAESEWSIDVFINEMEYHLRRLKEKKKEITKAKQEKYK